MALDSDWRTRHATLYSTRRRTESRCNWHSTGGIWSHHRTSMMRIKHWTQSLNIFKQKLKRRWWTLFGAAVALLRTWRHNTSLSITQSFKPVEVTALKITEIRNR